MQAIVLSRRDFREVDQIVSVYTDSEGKREIIAKGVKKITSKNAAHLEPGSFVSMDIARGKELDYLTTVQSINFFTQSRMSFQKTWAIGSAMAFVDHVTKAEDIDMGVFALLKQWLFVLEKVEGYNPILLDAFIMKLLAVIGFEPVLNSCCVSEIDQKEIIKAAMLHPNDPKFQPGFYPAGGGLVSAEVRREKLREGEHVITCSFTDITNLHLLLEKSFEAIIGADIGKQDAQSLHQIIDAFRVYHVGK